MPQEFIVQIPLEQECHTYSLWAGSGPHNNMIQPMGRWTQPPMPYPWLHKLRAVYRLGPVHRLDPAQHRGLVWGMCYMWHTTRQALSFDSRASPDWSCWSQHLELIQQGTTCSTHPMSATRAACSVHSQSNLMCCMLHAPATKYAVHMACGVSTGCMLPVALGPAHTLQAVLTPCQPHMSYKMSSGTFRGSVPVRPSNQPNDPHPA